MLEMIRNLQREAIFEKRSKSSIVSFSMRAAEEQRDWKRVWESDWSSGSGSHVGK
jgi:hypothetical protein